MMDWTELRRLSVVALNASEQESVPETAAVKWGCRLKSLTPPSFLTNHLRVSALRCGGIVP